MGGAIGQSLALAVGVALSPVPIMVVVLMLTTPRAHSNGPAFVLGWLAGLGIMGTIVLDDRSAQLLSITTPSSQPCSAWSWAPNWPATPSPDSPDAAQWMSTSSTTITRPHRALRPPVVSATTQLQR
jgi:hypothetical protein